MLERREFLHILFLSILDISLLVIQSQVVLWGFFVLPLQPPEDMFPQVLLYMVIILVGSLERQVYPQNYDEGPNEFN